MTRCKRYLSVFLALIMCIGILPITSITVDSNDGLLNFTKTSAYSDSVFTDVHEDDWFSDNVKAVYEYELMNGKGNSCFDPENSVTIAETITIAARLNAQYYIGTDVFVDSEPWYQTYVDYAENCGIIDDATDDFNAPATRGIFADIIANALPDSAFEEINIVAYSGIPDVSLTDSFGRAVYKLYRAGIMIGNDESGTFAPESNIKRCEVAAIVTRMVEPSLRKTVQLGREYAVSFELGYEGKKLDVQKVVEGYTAEEPDTPVRKNYIFDGWYTAQNGGYKFEFETEILSDMTLYAHWKKDPAYLSWVMSGIANGDKDTPNDPDKPDDPKEEYDYSKLPYRPGKTWEELTEVNGGKEPYIELNDNDQVGLYIGRISDNKVTDVYNVIAELNNVRELLNINDARFEFIPYPGDNGSIGKTTYYLQQVYKGVQVKASEIVVEVDNNGYIIAFMSGYLDYIRFSASQESPDITISGCENIIRSYFEDAEIKFENVQLLINDDDSKLLYDCSILVDEEAYIVWVDAQFGSIVSKRLITPSYAEIIDVYGGYFTNNSGTVYKGVMFNEKISDDAAEYIVRSAKCKEPHTSITLPNSNEEYMDNVIAAESEKDTAIYDSINTIYSVYNNVVEHASVNGDGLPIVAFSNAYCGESPDKEKFFKERPWKNAVSYSNRLYNLKNDPYPGDVYVLVFGFPPHNSLKTVGHEYTHGVQKYVVGYNGKDMGFAYAFSNEQCISGYIPFSESHALSEGTADVMGVLATIVSEKKCDHNEENCIVALDDLFDGQYSRDDGDYKKGEYISWNPKTKDSFNRTYTQLKEAYSSKESGYKYSCGCYIPANQLPYGFGPGHNDRYICNGILYSMVEGGLNNPETLMKLWYGAMCRLNSKSGLHELRHALVLSGLTLVRDNRLIDTDLEIITKACDAVEITAETAPDKLQIWFNYGIEKAYQNGIITQDDAVNRATDIITRREYLDLLANMCEKVGVNVDSDVVAWAKKLRVIGNLWTDDYLDESIPKWQVTLLMYQIFNQYHTEFETYGWKPVYTYAYGAEDGIDYYYNFTRFGFVDWGNSIPKTIDLNEMLQYYRGKEDIEAFQHQYMFSHVPSINYVSGNKDDENTRHSLYYMGFYQLWRNGMFEGYSSSGKLRLGTTDSISLGEACALITQVIPD